MSVCYESISISQIGEEKRWDVPFNIELKNLYQKKANLVTIEEISIHITNGATPLGAQFFENGVHFYRANDVKRYSFDYFNHKCISSQQSKTIKRSILRLGDIVFTIKGKVGDVAVFPENQEESNINQDNALIRLKEGYDPYYFCGIFNSKFGLNQVKAFATETINPFLGLGNLKKLRLPLLDKELQDSISNKVKLAINRELEALALIKKAQILFYEKLGIDFSKLKKENFFTANLSDFSKADLWTPAYSYPLYVNTINCIQKKWKTVPLGEIVTAKGGDEVGSNNYNTYLDKKDSDIPFIRTSDIVNFEVDQFPDFYIPKEIYQELKQDIKPGDVLFNNDGRIGLAAMLTSQDKIILQSHIKRLRLKKEAIEKYSFTQEFIFLVLTIKEIAIYQAERYKVIQSTIPTISNHILDFEIPTMDKNSIDDITKIVEKAFEIKDERKKLIRGVREEVDNYFYI